MVVAPPLPDAPAAAAAPPWTCPFCALLCDGFTVRAQPGGSLALEGSDCPRARANLARFTAQPPAAGAAIDGQPASFEQAVAAAARLLRHSRLPLLGGLGTDVAGARALYPLAERCGAITDTAAGPALFKAARALQDRGGFTTTLAELRNRADLVLCLTRPTERFPEFWCRAGLGDTALVPQRRLVYLGVAPEDLPRAQRGTAVDALALQDGDLFTTLAVLQALAAGRPLEAAPGLAALAQALGTARYAVLVWEPAALPPQGELAAEAIHQLVNTLNHRSRAASLALGGSEGAGTVQQAFAWLSGLPTRTHCSPAGLEHDPLRFDAARLLAGAGVDALLWVDAFGTLPMPDLPAGLPRVVLGHPDLAAASAPGVFIPVATPGIGHDGHLFRTDGTVLMPLRALRADTLPPVAVVARALTAALAQEGAR